MARHEAVDAAWFQVAGGYSCRTEAAGAFRVAFTPNYLHSDGMKNIRSIGAETEPVPVLREESPGTAGGPVDGFQAQAPLRGVRVAIAYDGLFPWSIGGIERWYHALAQGFVSAGAHVTYVTRLQWDEPPQLDGIDVVALRGPRDIYHPDGTRRADQPIRYAAALLPWMLRNRRSFDVLHLANFPYFPLLASRAALVGTDKPLFVDWFEVWPADYWRQYGGPIVGRLGYVIQQLCIRATPTALVFWEHTATRLLKHGLKNEPVILPGLLPEPQPITHAHARTDVSDSPPMVFFSGRHIKDKGVRMLPEALRIARQQLPELRMVIAGEGVETPLVKSRVSEFGLEDAVSFVGKLTDADIFRYIADAACVAVPSVREGYGLAAVEAAAHGTPAVVTDGPENAAVGHIVDGRNGFVVPPTPQGVADGIIRVIAAGSQLRQTTAEEFTRMTAESGIQRSVDRIVSLYAERLGRPQTGRLGAEPHSSAAPETE